MPQRKNAPTIFATPKNPNMYKNIDLSTRAQIDAENARAFDKPREQAYKKYRCTQCGHVREIQTNHHGECYSYGHFNTCPKCPPYKKYPEYGGSTTWECVEGKETTHD